KRLAPQHSANHGYRSAMGSRSLSKGRSSQSMALREAKRPNFKHLVASFALSFRLLGLHSFRGTSNPMPLFEVSHKVCYANPMTLCSILAMFSIIRLLMKIFS
ncbi:unnamed protein product, partial [Chrysoparadoxa australica]